MPGDVMEPYEEKWERKGKMAKCPARLVKYGGGEGEEKGGATYGDWGAGWEVAS